MSASQRASGRPQATTHGAIEAAAFDLFRTQGFDATTMDEIAEALGVGKRTLFRYYASKNDIPWGQFDRTLEGFRRILEQMPGDLPLHEAIHRGVVAFNDFPADARPPHRERMRVILQTPALQAHSVLRYADWRRVIAEYTATRLGMKPEDLMPRTIGQVSLALALSAYDQWLHSPNESLPRLLDDAMAAILWYFRDEPVLPHPRHRGHRG